MPILAVLDPFRPGQLLAPAGALWQEPAACRALLGRFLEYRACCRSSVVEHSIGNGEVDSSILSGSTIHLLDLYTFILIDLDWPSNTELNWNHHVTTRSSFAVLPGLSHP